MPPSLSMHMSWAITAPENIHSLRISYNAVKFWSFSEIFVIQVEDLARLSFKRKPLYVGVDDKQTQSTREGLEQGYCVVPSEQRFLLLFTFLKKNMNKKVMVFFSSCASVKYHAELLNYIDVPVKVRRKKLFSILSLSSALALSICPL